MAFVPTVKNMRQDDVCEQNDNIFAETAFMRELPIFSGLFLLATLSQRRSSTIHAVGSGLQMASLLGSQEPQCRLCAVSTHREAEI